MAHSYPANSAGFIDEKEVFTLAHSVLSLPLGALEDITPYELSWLLEAHYKKEREWFELLNHTIVTSIVSANSGKKIPLFKDDSKVEQKEHKNKKVFSSVEEKRAEFSKMKEQFK